MAQIEIDGKVLELDGDGFLIQPEEWNEKVADILAKEDGIDALTETHWAVINIIREHYKETDSAPMVRKICKGAGIKLKQIYDLFPSGPARGACKVAGLPKPDGCV